MKPAHDEKADELKRKHNAKTVYKLEVEDDDERVYAGWIRKPNIDEIGAFASMSQANPVKAAQVLINTCWLEGDEEIRNEEELFLGVMGVLDEIIKVKLARVTKH